MIYGYLRVSTDKQDANNQKIGVERKAAELGLKIDDYISDDGISGAKEPEKRKLGGLLKSLKQGDVIISSELSRFGRSLYMVMRILEHCMKTGVKVYTVKDNYELGDNIQSKVLAFAFGLAAEIEREMISKRTKEGIEKKRLEGVIFGRPAGRKNKNTKLDPRRDEVKELFDRGISMSAMGRVLGVHRFTVTRYCEEQGWLTREKGKNSAGCIAPPQTVSGIDYETVKQCLTEGLGYKETALACGVSLQSVSHYIQKNTPLYGIYVEKQTEKRLFANGVMNRSVQKGF